MKRLLIVLIVLTIKSVLLAADDPEKIKTGNGFLELCSAVEKIGASEISNSDLANIGVCTGYMMGLKDGLRLANASAVMEHVTTRKIHFCPADDVTVGQEVRVVLKYIRDHPQKDHLHTSILAAAALEQAFPCTSQ